MSLIIRIVVLVILLPATAAADKARSNAYKNCRATYGKEIDSVMACQRYELQARDAVRHLRKRGGRAVRKLVNACIRQSRGVVRGVDWGDALACSHYYVKRWKSGR